MNASLRRRGAAEFLNESDGQAYTTLEDNSLAGARVKNLFKRKRS
jgi:hypothetical protein